MKCFGKYGTYSNCSICKNAVGCRAIEAFDKAVARSNRRYAVLRIDADRIKEAV